MGWSSCPTMWGNPSLNAPTPLPRRGSLVALDGEALAHERQPVAVGWEALPHEGEAAAPLLSPERPREERVDPRPRVLGGSLVVALRVVRVHEGVAVGVVDLDVDVLVGRAELVGEDPHVGGGDASVLAGEVAEQRRV